MKVKLCISVGKETLELIKQKVARGEFRNTSHGFEFAVQQLKQGGDDEQ